MTTKFPLIFVLILSAFLFADSIPVVDDSVVIEKPEYIEDDESQTGNIERAELLSVK
jgi:hypothetical protein